MARLQNTSNGSELDKIERSTQIHKIAASVPLNIHLI